MSASRHSLFFVAPFSVGAEAAEAVAVPSDPKFTADELAAEYQRGRLDGARESDQDIERRFVEFRSEVSSVLSGLFARLSEAEASVSKQVHAALPELTVEVAKRVLSGYTPPPDVVEGLCANAIAAVYPEVSDLEVVVGERDRGIIERIVPGWQSSFPGLKVCVNPTFSPGECQVRSRFGVIDARHEAKLRVLRRELEA